MRPPDVIASSVPPDLEVRFDTTHYPVLRLVFPRERLTGEALHDMMRRANHLTDQDVRVAIILDFGDVTFIPNPKQRASFAAWQQQRAHRHRKVIMGTAIVVRSVVLRGAITAVNWLTRPVTPQHAAIRFEDALTWCRDVLAR